MVTIALIVAALQIDVGEFNHDIEPRCRVPNVAPRSVKLAFAARVLLDEVNELRHQSSAKVRFLMLAEQLVADAVLGQLLFDRDGREADIVLRTLERLFHPNVDIELSNIVFIRRLNCDLRLRRALAHLHLHRIVGCQFMDSRAFIVISKQKLFAI